MGSVDDLAETEEEYEDTAFAQLVTLMRIYDVLMADLTLKEPGKAQALLEAHAKGIIITPVPAYSGVHVVKEDSGPPDTGNSDDPLDNSLEG